MRCCKFPRKSYSNNPRHLLYLLFCLIVSVAAFSSSAYAQTVTTRVNGTIKDKNEAVVSGAKVTLLDLKSRDEKSTTTNDQGYFTFTDVQVGSYVLTVEGSGFKKTQIN